jgi:PAS domain S-box-containing protein
MADDDDVASLLEYTQDRVVVVDRTGEFVWVNSAADRILGFEPDELVGESAFEYIHPDDVTRARAVFERVVTAEEETTETVRYRHCTADGSWVWLESRLSNLRNSTLGGYVVSSRDISEQMDTEARLTELTRTVNDVLWMFDADWSELLFINPAYEEVYGGSRLTLRDNPTAFLDRIHPDDRSLVEDAMARLSAGESVDVEHRVNPDMNYDVWVSVRGQPVVNDGDVVRIAGFSRDVTDRRGRRQQLTVMDNLLRHNLRNELSVVLGHAEMITNGRGDATASAEAIRETCETLIETAEKQRRIIELLTDSKGRERLDLTETVVDAVDTVRERFPSARIDLTAPESVSASAHHQFGLAVIELIENAIQCHPETDGEVEVIVQPYPEVVEVSVQDACPPIPEQEIQVLTGKREMEDIYHTSGLGLWLVYWVVHRSDGTITFDRSSPTGNTVTVTLSP